MSIKDICTTDAISITKDSTLKQAAQKMSDYHVGSLVVTNVYNNKEFPAGIITDRDVALCLSSSERPQDIKVELVMKSYPVTIKYTDGIYVAAKIMLENAVKRLPVVNDDGSLYGIVSADDILSLVGEETYNLTRLTNSQILRERGVRMPSKQYIQL